MPGVLQGWSVGAGLQPITSAPMGIARKAAAVAGAGVAAVGAVEALHRRAPGNKAAFSDEGFAATRPSPDHLRLHGRVVVRNLIPDREVMLTDVTPRVVLLSDAAIDGLTTRVTVASNDPNYPPRSDGHFTAYVIHPADETSFEVDVDVHGPPADLGALYAAWIDVRMATYGGEGPRPRSHHVVLSLRDAEPTPPRWRDIDGARVLPILTHLLTPADDPVAVVQKYATPHAQPGDVVAIGETPLAIMQGRFRHPDEIPLSWFAKRFSPYMSGEGSLGTASGLQVLVDQVGAPRVLFALGAGFPMKALGAPGWFYRLVGDQARLVDDVTGTLPPYDQFVVMGPEDAEGVCAAVHRATGLGAVVADANNLGKVDLMGPSTGVDEALVKRALTSNPAGNGAETTPLVLIRPM